MFICTNSLPMKNSKLGGGKNLCLAPTKTKVQMYFSKKNGKVVSPPGNVQCVSKYTKYKTKRDRKNQKKTRGEKPINYGTQWLFLKWKHGWITALFKILVKDPLLKAKMCLKTRNTSRSKVRSNNQKSKKTGTKEKEKRKNCKNNKCCDEKKEKRRKKKIQKKNQKNHATQPLRW